MERHKMVLSNNKMYYEVELAASQRRMRIGTERDCDVRLNGALFFEGFYIVLENQPEGWQLVCGDNNYVSSDGILRQAARPLRHGDNLTLKYTGSNQEILNLGFTLDFEYENKNYDRVIDLSGREELRLGPTQDCDIVLSDPLLAGGFITMRRDREAWIVTDHATPYGVYHNGIRSQQPVRLCDYDFFSVVGYSFYYKYDHLYTANSPDIIIHALPHIIEADSDGVFGYPVFNRNTRIRVKPSQDEIPVLDPPPLPNEPQQNIVMSLLPTIGMLAVVVLVRGQMMGGNSSFIIFSICSMGIGMVTSIISFVGSKRKYKKELANRHKKYTEYIEKKRAEVKELRRQEKHVLEEMYPGPGLQLERVQAFSSDLFDRTVEDEDFLHLRLGTGPQPARRPVAYKQQETLEVLDEIAQLPAALCEEFSHLAAAPVVIDGNKAGAVGIIGNRKRLYEIFKNLLLDTSTRQYYSDAELYVMMGEEDAQALGWIRMLPHLENERLGIRNIICDDESKNFLFEYLYKTLSQREATDVSKPKMVIFCYRDPGIKSHPISNYFERAEKMGITFLFFEERKARLPLGCTRVVLLNSTESGGRVVSSTNDVVEEAFAYEPIEDAQAADFVQKLAPVYCEEISLESSLTKNISLFELLDIHASDDLDYGARWQASQIHKTMAAPLGVNSKNEVVALDLHEKYHGPHGLVAGTTGSGKSEILQSYILSMATLYHPYEVGFVIIDFKGGGMVNQFRDLPHLVGSITNIDGREINRSLLSIKAELRKRQTLFAQADVNHIDAYIQQYKSGKVSVPLPHLILIVDEFAELKMDQPEFMKELVSAARIGRSLGVHLILATQKPSGVVDAQIWSNSKFKLCLKVQNKEDSNEVLKSPLAAEIKEPGRAYLQVGNNEIFELFQSAYSGAPAGKSADRKKAFKLHDVSLWGRRTTVFEQKSSNGDVETISQLDSLVESVAAYANAQNLSRLPGICLPPLRTEIGYAEAEPLVGDTELRIALGIYDDPNHQLQAQASLNLLGGNVFILGASQFGKTALLQLFLRGIADNNSPDDVAVYVLDFASMALKVFDSLCHVGGVITPADDVKLMTFFRMMSREVALRKDKLSKMGITSFASYREAGFTDLPAIVIMLDNMIAFRELYPDYEETFLSFCMEGAALGINIVATSTQTRNIGYKYLANFPNRIALYCNQRDDYSAMFERCRMEPASVPGRGLISFDKEIFEFQSYLAFEGEKEIDRVNDIKRFIEATSKRYPNKQARRIPEIPDLLTPEYLEEQFGGAVPGVIRAGIGYSTVEPVAFTLAKMGHLAILGKEQSGKTNFAQYLFAMLAAGVEQYPVRAYIVDGYERQLEPLQSHSFVESYSTELEDLVALLKTMDEECVIRREAVKKQGIAAQKDMPLLLVCVQNKEFFETGSLGKEAIETFKRVMRAARELKIFFFFAELENMPVAYGATDTLKYVKDNRNLLFFDDLASLKMVDVGLSDLRANKKPIETGDAYFVEEKGITKLKTPFVKT